MQPREATQRVWFDFLFFFSFRKLFLLVSIFPFSKFFTSIFQIFTDQRSIFFLSESHRTPLFFANGNSFSLFSFLHGKNYFFVGKFKEIFSPKTTRRAATKTKVTRPVSGYWNSHTTKNTTFFVSEIRTLIPIVDWRLIQMAVGTRLNATSLSKIESLLLFLLIHISVSAPFQPNGARERLCKGKTGRSLMLGLLPQRWNYTLGNFDFLEFSRGRIRAALTKWTWIRMNFSSKRKMSIASSRSREVLFSSPKNH